MATGNTIKLYDHIFSRAMPVPTLTFSHALTVFVYSARVVGAFQTIPLNIPFFLLQCKMCVFCFQMVGHYFHLLAIIYMAECVFRRANNRIIVSFCSRWMEWNALRLVESEREKSVNRSLFRSCQDYAF